MLVHQKSYLKTSSLFSNLNLRCQPLLLMAPFLVSISYLPFVHNPECPVVHKINDAPWQRVESVFFLVILQFSTTYITLEVWQFPQYNALDE